MSEKNLPTFFRDFLGVLAVAFTLFALISLMTYDPEDPSFNKSFNIKPEAISNQGGLVGA
ncbi:MAG: DNA translocase FtsK 4TM domain-containing protein, partial [Nitrospinales bacterium]